MPMPELILDVERRLIADFGHLVLQDPEHPDLASGRRGDARDPVAVAGTGLVQLLCLGQLPEPWVRVQLWSGPPDRPADRDGEFQTELEARHPLLVLGPPTASPSDIIIDLPHAGHYHVRLYRTALPVRPSSVPGIPIQPEHWLVQIWPRSTE